MNALSLTDLDQIRQAGLRPTVVGCFLNEGKVLMVYQEEYDLWQFPQGGIDDPQSSAEEALAREMREEMGEDLIIYANSSPVYMGRDQIVFKESKQNMRKIYTTDGKQINMMGKCYLFYAIDIPVQHLDMEASEFDKYRWLTLAEAIEKAETIYQPGKQRITKKALELLEEQKFIS